MNRGDIYWVDLNPTKGAEIKKKRPCILVGANPINRARRTVVVVPLSTSAKVLPPMTIALNCLSTVSVAVCDQIRTVDKTRLGECIGHATSDDLNALDDGLRQVLSLQPDFQKICSQLTFQLSPGTLAQFAGLRHDS